MKRRVLDLGTPFRRAEAPQPDSHLDLASDKDDPMEAFGTRQPDSPPAERRMTAQEWRDMAAADGRYLPHHSVGWLVVNGEVCRIRHKDFINEACVFEKLVGEPAPTAEPPKPSEAWMTNEEIRLRDILALPVPQRNEHLIALIVAAEAAKPEPPAPCPDLDLWKMADDYLAWLAVYKGETTEELRRVRRFRLTGLLESAFKAGQERMRARAAQRVAELAVDQDHAEAVRALPIAEEPKR